MAAASPSPSFFTVADKVKDSPASGPVSLTEGDDTTRSGYFTGTCGVGGGGGSVTCKVAVPDRSPAVAVIVTSPAWIPVASPVELIVATTSSELVHVNSTSGTAVPSSVVAAAWNSCMPPTSTEAEDGLTDTRPPALVEVDQ